MDQVAMAFFSARKLSRDPALTPVQKSYMVGAQIACLLFLFSMPYKKSLLINPSFSLYSMFVLGYIAFWYSRLNSGVLTRDAESDQAAA